MKSSRYFRVSPPPFWGRTKNRRESKRRRQLLGSRERANFLLFFSFLLNGERQTCARGPERGWEMLKIEKWKKIIALFLIFQTAPQQQHAIHNIYIKWPKERNRREKPRRNPHRCVLRLALLIVFFCALAVCGGFIWGRKIWKITSLSHSPNCLSLSLCNHPILSKRGFLRAFLSLSEIYSTSILSLRYIYIWINRNRPLRDSALPRVKATKSGRTRKRLRWAPG